MASVLNPFAHSVVATTATYVADAYGSGGTGIVIPASAQAGDLALLITAGDADNNPPTGWSFIGGSLSLGSTGLYGSQKVLASGEPGSTLSVDAQGTVVVFRNCSTATFKNSATDSPANTLDVAGFTLSGSHKGLVTACASSSGTPSNPTGFTNLTQRLGDASGVPITHLFRVGYNLTSYTGGTITFTNSESAQFGGLSIELT